MTTWKTDVEFQHVVGSKVVYATVSCEKGKVSLSGDQSAVQELIDSLNHKCQDEKVDGSSLVRFVFVNKDGMASAMAFECSTVGDALTLQTLEQIENFASSKLGESVLAETWSVMAKTPKAFAVVGDDVVGGVKCESDEPLEPEGEKQT